VKSRLILGGAVVVLALSIPASADDVWGARGGYFFTTNCHNGDGSGAGAPGFGGGGGAGIASVLQPFDSGLTACGYLGYADAQASGNADASLGVLHANSIGSVNGQLAAAGARTTSEWFDQITLTSSSLAQGTPVTLLLSMGLDAVLTDNPGPIPPDATTANDSFTANLVSCSLFNCGGAPTSASLYLGETVPGTYTDGASTLMLAHIGDVISLDGILRTEADAFGLQSRIGPNSLTCGFGCSDTASVNALDTALFAITPQGDFSYTSASGTIYATSLSGPPSAVPEPNGSVLVGLALACLLAGPHREARARPRSRQ